MKAKYLSRFFIGIALLTSVSMFAQATESETMHEGIKVEYSLKQAKVQDFGDIESLREIVEVNQVELMETTEDRRFNGRQFLLADKKS